MPKPRTTKVGTVPPWPPGYQAPEVVDNQPIVGELLAAAVDVFSLGVLLARRLLGRFPYAWDSYVGVLQAQRGGEHCALPNTSLGQLLGAMLHPDPSRRPSMRDVIAALDELS